MVTAHYQSGKNICIGRNYAEHAAETGASVPEIPVVFSKFPTALTGHQSEIILPPLVNKLISKPNLWW